MTVPKALRAIQFVLPEWMFIYSGASLGSVAIRVNISFQPDEEPKGAHLLYGQAPGWLTSSRLEKPLPQLSWHVRVTRASIVPKHKLWLIQRTYTIHSHAYLARSSSLFSFCLGFLYTSLRQRLTRGTAKRIVCLFFPNFYSQMSKAWTQCGVVTGLPISQWSTAISTSERSCNLRQKLALRQC